MLSNLQVILLATKIASKTRRLVREALLNPSDPSAALRAIAQLAADLSEATAPSGASAGPGRASPTQA
jgi:hypothetical protein